MSTNNGDSPAMRVMEEAIELAIDERSPYPERAAFINADTPNSEKTIKRALDDERRAVVLVSADGSTRVLLPETVRG